MKTVALIHRLSGVGLALFLPVHFWALGKGLQLDEFLRWTEQPLVKFAEWGIVVLLAAHLAADCACSRSSFSTGTSCRRVSRHSRRRSSSEPG